MREIMSERRESRRMKEFRIYSRFFEMIRSGRKTAELRPGRDSYQNIHIGDRVCFVSGVKDGRIVVEITDVRIYSSLEDVLEHENIERIAPGMDAREARKTAEQMFQRNLEGEFMVFDFRGV